jgi:putative oxidoreductase
LEEEMGNAKIILLLAGVLSLAVAVFQVYLGFSPTASAYWGGPTDQPMLLFAALVVGLVFAVWGLYGLSGAGVIRRLPLLRLGLIVIGGIYTLRGIPGIMILLILAGIIRDPQPIPPQALISSLVSLAVGLAYLIGTIAAWPALSRKPPRAAAG